MCNRARLPVGVVVAWGEDMWPEGDACGRASPVFFRQQESTLSGVSGRPAGRYISVHIDSDGEIVVETCLDIIRHGGTTTSTKTKTHVAE